MYSFELRGLLILGLTIWIIARIIILVTRRKKGVKFNIGDEILTNIFIIYLFFLIGVTILPIYIGGMLEYIQELSLIERCNISVVPFADYFKDGVFFSVIIRNLVGNLVLLIPLILYGCIRNEKLRSLKSSAKIAFLTSLSIELIQLFMNIFGLTYLRAVDVDDLILNTLGGIIAWCIFKLMYKGKMKSIIDIIYPKLIEGNEIKQY